MPVSSPPKSESRKLSPKLRYKAYELPPSTPPKRSHLATPRHSPNMTIERSPLRRPGLIDTLSNTVSPGELALAAGSDQLEIVRIAFPSCQCYLKTVPIEEHFISTGLGRYSAFVLLSLVSRAIGLLIRISRAREWTLLPLIRLLHPMNTN